MTATYESAGATLSGEVGGKPEFRWNLSRTWGDGSPVVFAMLNPSTADDADDDNTIRRCVGFARARGYGRLIVVNLFPYRTRSPQKLRIWHDVHSQQNHEAFQHCLATNDGFISAAADMGDVVVAWGQHGEHYPLQTNRIMRLLKKSDCHIYRLGPTTAAGQPRHPLYLSNATPWVKL